MNTNFAQSQHLPQALKVLRIDSSGRQTGSVTRQLADHLIAAIEQVSNAPVSVVRRDVAEGIPFVDEAWIQANFTDPAARSPAQQQALAYSDALVREVLDADVLVIGLPIYNFGIPATLKAWIDMIARARLTFRYSENGPIGLLAGKKAYVIVASGGTPIEGTIDFATPYLRHALGFVGVTDVEVIAAERLMLQGEAAQAEAQARIAALLKASAPAPNIAA